MLSEREVLVDACIYARKSTTKFGQKETVENQIEGCMNEAPRFSIRVVDTKVDIGTGTDDLSRPEIKELINDGINGKYKCVIMKGISRFYRDVEKGLGLIKQLDRHGIRVITLEESFDSQKDRTGTGKLDTSKITMYLMFAEMESKKLADRIKFTQTVKAKRGEWNHAQNTPFGYGYNPETKKLIIDQEKSTIVQLIFKMYLSGMGMRQIMHFLNGDNEDNKQYPSPKGNRWSQYTIGFILKNEAYIGTVVYNKRSKKERTYKQPELFGKSKDDSWVGNDLNDEAKWIRSEDAHEAIIEPKTFYEAKAIQDKKAVRKGIRSNVGLLSGIGQCGECKSGLTFKRGNKNSVGWIKTKSNYYCMNYIKYGKRYCSSHHIGADELEVIVENHLVELYNDKKRLEEIFNKRKMHLPSDIEKLNREKIQLESEIKKTANKMDKLLEKNINEEITDLQYNTMNKKFSSELDSYTKQIEMLNNKIGDSSSATETEKKYRALLDKVVDIDNMTKEEKRYLFLDLIAEVVLYANKDLEITVTFEKF